MSSHSRRHRSPKTAPQPAVGMGCAAARGRLLVSGTESRLPRRKRWSRRTWSLIRFAGGIALGGIALWAVSGRGAELAGASTELSHLDVGGCWSRSESRRCRSWPSPAWTSAYWLAAASARAWDGSPRFLRGRCYRQLAAGRAGGRSAFGFRQFRRLGASETLAAWTLLATLVFSALGLALLATAGVVVAERQGAALDLVGVIVGIFAITLAGAAAVYQRRALARVFTWILEASHRITGFPRRPADEIVSPSPPA